MVSYVSCLQKLDLFFFIFLIVFFFSFPIITCIYKVVLFVCVLRKRYAFAALLSSHTNTRTDYIKFSLVAVATFWKELSLG